MHSAKNQYRRRIPFFNSFSFRLLLFFFLLAISTSFHSRTAHPFYLSVTEVEYLHGKKEIQIACKLFADDFEEALHKTYGKKINLRDVQPSPYNDSLINLYLNKHLSVSLDGKQIRPVWEGKELQQEALWCYLSASSSEGSDRLKVVNDLLCHSIPEQINIVHLKAGNKKISCRLNLTQTTCQLALK